MQAFVLLVGLTGALAGYSDAQSTRAALTIPSEGSDCPGDRDPCPRPACGADAVTPRGCRCAVCDGPAAVTVAPPRTSEAPRTPAACLGRTCPIGVECDGRLCNRLLHRVCAGGIDYSNPCHALSCGFSEEDISDGVCTGDNDNCPMDRDPCPRPACGDEAVTPRGCECAVCRPDEPVTVGPPVTSLPVPCPDILCTQDCGDAGYVIGRDGCQTCSCNPSVVTVGPITRCRHNGQVYNDTDTWVEPEQPCTVHMCLNGQVQRTRIQCEDSLVCEGGARPTLVDGDCCPSCPTDGDGHCFDSDGGRHRNGATWSSDDPCMMFFCDEGWILREHRACEEPACQNPIHVEGQCCATCQDECSGIACNMPVCEGGVEPQVEEGDCCPSCPVPDDGAGRPCTDPLSQEVHPDGAEWTLDRRPCTVHSCDNGIISSEQQFCLSPQCPEGVGQVRIPGQCCAICAPETTARPMSTTEDCSLVDCLPREDLDCGEGVRPIPGPCCPMCPPEDLETTARPMSTTEDCSLVDCLPREDLDCGEGVRPIPGPCCPMCPPEDGSCMARDGTGLHPDGDHWIDPSFACRHLWCNAGEISEAIQDCARPQCENPVPVPGQCCRVCPDPTIAPGGCVDRAGNQYREDQQWFDAGDPCIMYTCRHGRIQEATLDCPAALCDAPIRVRGECCPVCPDTDTTTRPGDGTCTDSAGVRHRDGASWTTDNEPCSMFMCTEGTISEAHMDCEEPSCQDPINTEGECCPVCPDNDGTCTDPLTDDVYASGENWNNAARPCEHHICDEGRISTAVMHCARPPCENPIRVDGECCSMCPVSTPVAVADDTTTTLAGDSTTTRAADGTCPRNCGLPERGGGTCRPDGRCLSCNENRLRVNGRCVQSLACRGRRIQSGSMAGQGCRCTDDNCHNCNRGVEGDACRVCRDGWFLLAGACHETCPESMASMGIGQFKRRCMAPFACENGRIVGQDVNYGCKCATDENTPASCQFCDFRAGEFGTHCTRCNGAQYLFEDRCQDSCDGTGLIAYAPGNYGRECRSPFTCANRLDGTDSNSNACKCPRSVGRNDCTVCDFTETGASCARCTNAKYLRGGTCVTACREGEQSVGEGDDGRECV